METTNATIYESPRMSVVSLQMQGCALQITSTEVNQTPSGEGEED